MPYSFYFGGLCAIAIGTSGLHVFIPFPFSFADTNYTVSLPINEFGLVNIPSAKITSVSVNTKLRNGIFVNIATQANAVVNTGAYSCGGHVVFS